MTTRGKGNTGGTACISSFGLEKRTKLLFRIHKHKHRGRGGERGGVLGKNNIITFVVIIFCLFVWA